jgi:hypothetical protein
MAPKKRPSRSTKKPKPKKAPTRKAVANDRSHSPKSASTGNTYTFYVGAGSADAMTNDRFWSIIAATRPADGFDAQVKKLTDLLAALSVDEVDSFETIFYEYRSRAEDSDQLREMAHELGGGAGDDGWSDFCSWVISRGQKVYKDALRDPETLRSIAAESEAVDFEEFQYVAGRVINRAHGGDEV